MNDGELARLSHHPRRLQRRSRRALTIPTSPRMHPVAGLAVRQSTAAPTVRRLRAAYTVSLDARGETSGLARPWD